MYVYKVYFIKITNGKISVTNANKTILENLKIVLFGGAHPL